MARSIRKQRPTKPSRSSQDQDQISPADFVLVTKFTALNNWINITEERYSMFKVQLNKIYLDVRAAIITDQTISVESIHSFMSRFEQALLDLYQGGPAQSLFQDELEEFRNRMSHNDRADQKRRIDDFASSHELVCSAKANGDYEALQIAVSVWLDCALDAFEGALIPAQRLRDEYITRMSATPSSPVDNPHHVEIWKGPDTIVLSRPGHTNYSIEPDDYRLFRLFLSKVAHCAPGEIVPWADVNQAVSKPGSDPDSARASPQTRDRLKDLRKKLEVALGATPTSCEWIETVKGQGLRLNTSVSWCISPDLVESMSPKEYDRAHPTDPNIMAKQTSDTAHRRR